MMEYGDVFPEYQPSFSLAAPNYAHDPSWQSFSSECDDVNTDGATLCLNTVRNGSTAPFLNYT